jgi:Nitroreductase
MNVIEAIYARHSARAFLSKPVEKEKLNAVFEAAAHTSSWANTQPWEVFVATGATLDKIKKGYQQKYAEKAAANPETTPPAQWTEAAKKRMQRLYPDMRRDCGEAVEQFGSLNQTMFNAPAVIYICVDKILSQWSLYDIGAYSQSIVLAAMEQGLATVPAITLMLYPEILRKEMEIPDNLKLTIGIAIGYADKDNKINSFISSRDPIDESVHIFD